jgi:hypothetical protein
MQQGFSKLTDLATQKGAIMSEGIRQNKQAQADAAKMKMQQSQQIFDSAVTAVNTYSAMKERNRQAEREKEADARAAEEFRQRKQVFEQQKAERNAQAQAIVNDNKKELSGPTPNGDPLSSGPVERIKVPDSLKNAPVEEQAAYIKSIQDIDAKREAEAAAAQDMADKKAKEDAELRLKKEELGLKKSELGLKREEAQTKAASDWAKGANDSLAKIADATKNPNRIYTMDLDERDIKANDKSRERIAGNITALDQFRESKRGLLKIGGLSEDAELNETNLRNIAQKLKNASAETKARAGELYTKLLFSAKQPGMGQVSESEYVMMAKMSNSDALNYLATMEVGALQRLQDKMLNKFLADENREGSLKVLAEGIERNTQRTLEDSALELSKSGGLSATPKQQRDADLFKLLPEDKRKAPDAFDNFSKLSIKEQAVFVFGPDKAKQLKLDKAEDNDYLAQNPQELSRRAFKNNLIMEPTGLARTKETLSMYKNARDIALMSQITKRENAPMQPSVTGVSVPPGTGVLTSKPDGTMVPMIDANGLTFFLQAPPRSQASSTPRKINARAFGGKN